MTEKNDPKIEREESERYLYAEMNQKERDSFEEKIFCDDELFFEIVDLENRLVDSYAKGNLSGAELLRFEKSLEKSSERKQKVANAIAMQTYIEQEHRQKVSTASVVTAETPNLWEKITDIFTIRSPLINMTMAGLLLIFAFAAIFLLLDNRRKNDELTLLQDNKAEIEKLQNQISGSEQNIAELNNKLETKSAETDELIKTLGSEQQKIQQLDKLIERLQTVKDKPPIAVNTPAPEIVAIIPDKKITNGGKFSTASVGKNTKRIAVSLSLPETLKKDEKLTILLNEKPFLQNISPIVSADGEKSISLTIPTDDLPPGENRLTINNSEGKEITKYIFSVDKPED